jgi:hypothetical protein
MPISIMTLKPILKPRVNDLNTRKIERYEKIIVFLISAFTSFLIYKYSVFFDDYPRYSKYVITGRALARYAHEFIASYPMYFIGILGFDADLYYSFTWLVFAHSCYYSSKKTNHKNWILLFFILLMNPMGLILIQTPRSMCAFSFFLYALSTKGFLKKGVLCSLSFFSHLGFGAFSFLFVFLVHMNLFWVFLAYFISLIFYYQILIGSLGIFPAYASLNINSWDSGRGRLLLLISTAIISFIVLKLSKKRMIFMSMTYIFAIALFAMSVISHRLLIYPFFMIWLYFFSVNKKKGNLLLMTSYGVVIVIFSAYVVVTGTYGYGEVVEALIDLGSVSKIGR